MSENRTDAELVRACLDGDRGAFELLLDRHEGPIFNLAYRLVSRYEDACDVTQTVFLKAYERLGSFDAKYKFFSWLYRIAVNESMNQLGRANRFDPLEHEPVSTERGPGETAAGADLSRHVQRALRELKHDYRTVVVLRHFMDCSYREMARILDLPEKTVKSRLFTARRELRRALSEQGILR